MSSTRELAGPCGAHLERSINGFWPIHVHAKFCEKRRKRKRKEKEKKGGGKERKRRGKFILWQCYDAIVLLVYG